MGWNFWQVGKVRSRVGIAAILLIVALPWSVNNWAIPVYQGAGDDWPMLMHDPAHTGYTPDTLIPDPPSGQLYLKWKVGLGERVEITMQPIVEIAFVEADHFAHNE